MAATKNDELMDGTTAAAPKAPAPETAKTEPPAAAKTEPPAPAPTAADPRRMVKVKLYRGRKDGKGVFVSVNNHRYFVPRGTTVEVPYFIAEVLRNSEEQDEKTAVLIESLGQNSRF